MWKRVCDKAMFGLLEREDCVFLFQGLEWKWGCLNIRERC